MFYFALHIVPHLRHREEVSPEVYAMLHSPYPCRPPTRQTSWNDSNAIVTP
jgi:hypothetical protein